MKLPNILYLGLAGSSDSGPLELPVNIRTLGLGNSFIDASTFIIKLGYKFDELPSRHHEKLSKY